MTSFSSSTRINDLHIDNLHQHTGGQHAAGTPHIHDPTGLRFAVDNRCNTVNEWQNHANGHNSVNEHHISMNGCNNPVPCKTTNGIARHHIRTTNTEQSRLINGSTNNKKPEKTSERSSPKQNAQSSRNYRNNVDHKNGINRLTNGERSVNREMLRKEDSINIAANLRQLLRPTVTEKRQQEESAKVEYDAEDINGPYNFRQLLRPTGYLPTESLRKRKGGLVSNGVPLPKDKVPEKHVKRRAPLAPSQNKLANGKK